MIKGRLHNHWFIEGNIVPSCLYLFTNFIFNSFLLVYIVKKAKGVVLWIFNDGTTCFAILYNSSGVCFGLGDFGSKFTLCDWTEYFITNIYANK